MFINYILPLALADGNNIYRNMAMDQWSNGLDSDDNIGICKQMCVSVGCHGIWDTKLARCSCIIDFSTKGNKTLQFHDNTPSGAIFYNLNTILPQKCL